MKQPSLPGTHWDTGRKEKKQGIAGVGCCWGLLDERSACLAPLSCAGVQFVKIDLAW